MKLLIDNIKRTIIFKENKAFYKNKKEEVDITLFFKKSKDGISVLRKKYSHMLVSEDDRNILFGGGGTDLLKIELKKNDKEDTSKLFRKIIALYLMAEMYTNKDILDRRIDKEMNDDVIKQLIETKKDEIDNPGINTAIETSITKTLTSSSYFVTKETEPMDQEKEITKWVAVKDSLTGFKKYIEEQTTTIDTIATLLLSNTTPTKTFVGGAKLSSLTTNVLLKGNPVVVLAPPAVVRRNGKLLIQSPGIRANGVAPGGLPPGGLPPGPPSGGPPLQAPNIQEIVLTPTAIAHLNNYNYFTQFIKQVNEYINSLQILYSYVNLYFDSDKKHRNNMNRLKWESYRWPLNTYFKNKFYTTKTITTPETKTNAVKRDLDLDIELDLVKVTQDINTRCDALENALNALLSLDINFKTNIISYIKELKNCYIFILDLVIDKKIDKDKNQHFKKLLIINTIILIITESFKDKIIEYMTQIIQNPDVTSKNSIITKLLPKNYINNIMLDDMYLEKLVSVNNFSKKIDKDYTELQKELKKAAAKVSKILHYSNESKNYYSNTEVIVKANKAEKEEKARKKAAK